jgi:site-specific recombinase XerD
LAALQEILGHASIVTTQRYAKLGEAHVVAEAKRVHGEPSGEPMTLESNR